MSETRKIRRRWHYKVLRDCGFNAEMADKFKDNSYKKIIELCKIMKEAKQSKDEIDQRVNERFNKILKRV